MYNGSSFNQRIGFFLLLVLNPWVIFPIATIQCLFPSTTHQTDLSTDVQWTHLCTFLFFNLDSYIMSFWTHHFHGLLCYPNPTIFSSSLSWGLSIALLPMLLPLLSDPFWLLFILLSGTIPVLSSLLDFWVNESIHFFGCHTTLSTELAVSLSSKYLFMQLTSLCYKTVYSKFWMRPVVINIYQHINIHMYTHTYSKHKFYEIILIFTTCNTTVFLKP